MYVFIYSDSLKKNLQLNKGEISTLSANVKYLEIELQSTQHKHVDKEKMYQQTTKENMRLTMRLQELDRQHTTNIHDINENNYELSIENNKLKQCIQLQNIELLQMKMDYENEKDNSKSLQADSELLHQQIQEAWAIIDEQKKDKNSIVTKLRQKIKLHEQQIDNIKITNKQLLTSNFEATYNNCQLEQQVSRLQTTNEKLKNKLKQKHETLSKYIKYYKDMQNEYTEMSVMVDTVKNEMKNQIGMHDEK